MTKEQELYFEIRYKERVTDYKRVSETHLKYLDEEIIEEVAREKYSKKGGIDQYICDVTKREMNDFNMTHLKEIQKYFEPYHKIYSTYFKKDDREELFEKPDDCVNWFNNQDNKCCYCGVSGNDLKKYFNQDNEQYIDARQRGKKLEIERVVTSPKDKNIYNYKNCRLACYICNNAKSDFISPKDFKPIAKGISKFWKNQNVEIKFKEDDEIWNLNIKE